MEKLRTIHTKEWNLIDTIDMTPTPRGYAQMLLNILEHAEQTREGNEAKAFARAELIKAVVVAATQNPDAWGK